MLQVVTYDQDVEPMDVGPNLNPWVIMHGLTKNPVGGVIVEVIVERFV